MRRPDAARLLATLCVQCSLPPPLPAVAEADRCLQETEITGASDKISQFVDLMTPLGLVEVSRTGMLSIKRGKEKG